MLDKLLKCFTEDWPSLIITVICATAFVYYIIKPSIDKNTKDIGQLSRAVEVVNTVTKNTYDDVKLIKEHLIGKKK